MIKSRFILSLFSAIFSFIFITAGTGINIIHYCCGACESKGIEYVAQHSCHEIHHEEDFDTNCCQSVYDFNSPAVDYIVLTDVEAESCSANHCDIKRIELDDFSVSKNLHVSLFSIDYQFAAFVEALFAYLPTLDNPISYLANPPPEYSLPNGREILCNKAVLII